MSGTSLLLTEPAFVPKVSIASRASYRGGLARVKSSGRQCPRIVAVMGLAAVSWAVTERLVPVGDVYRCGSFAGTPFGQAGGGGGKGDDIGSSIL